MTVRKNVNCGNQMPSILEINADTVYKRSNIHTYTDSDGNQGYEYDEIELTTIEYLHEIYPQNEQALGELGILIATYQAQTDAAIAELSLALAGGI